MNGFASPMCCSRCALFLANDRDRSRRIAGGVVFGTLLPDVALHAFGLHTFEHGRFGQLAFEHTSYVPEGHPWIRVVVCTPENEAARQAVANVAASAPDAAPEAG